MPTDYRPISSSQSQNVPEDKFCLLSPSCRRAHGVAFAPVRSLGEFVRVRAFKVGYPKVEALVTATGKAKQTVYDLFEARTPEEAEEKHFGTREKVAEALLFTEWRELLEAWKDNDVLRGLEGGSGARSALWDRLREAMRWVAAAERRPEGEIVKMLASGTKSDDVMVETKAEAEASRPTKGQRTKKGRGNGAKQH